MISLLNAKEVIRYYSTHGVRSTLKKFGISYGELKRICKAYDFEKSPEQIRKSYETTRIEKYGSMEAFLESRRFHSEINRYNRSKEIKDED